MPDLDRRIGAVARLPDATVERAEFLTVGDRLILAFAHLPPGEPRAALVMCHSLYDAASVYRKEVVLGRRLAAAGVATLRLHYRGTGNSDDLPRGESLTVSSMAADVAAVVAWCKTLAPGAPLALLGTRYGALVAAEVALDHPDAALALWDPALSGPSYFRDVFRAAKVFGMKREGTPMPENPRAHMEEHGSVEALAQRIDLATYADAQPRTLPDRWQPSRSLLVIHVGRDPKLPTPLADAVAGWQAGGSAVATVGIRERRGWWFVQEPDSWSSEDGDPETVALVDTMTVAISKLLGAVS